MRDQRPRSPSALRLPSPTSSLRYRLLLSTLACILFPAQLLSQVDLTLGNLAPIPASGLQAASTIPLRQQALVANLACGQDLDFLRRARSVAGANKRDTSTGDAVNLSLAKMYWFLRMPDANQVARLVSSNPNDLNCHQDTFIPAGQVPPVDDAAPPFDNTHLENYQSDLDAMTTPNLTNIGLNNAFVRTFGQNCSQAITKVVKNADGYVITFSVSPLCLRDELNQALSEVYVTGQMGTGAGMPCHIVKTLTDNDGNWDFTMRSLIRALYLNRPLSANLAVSRIFVLQPAVRDHIQNDLIITETKLGEADYPITGCGDTENATGDASSRVDDGNFFKDLGNDLKGFLEWLLKHWYVLTELIPELGITNDVISTLLHVFEVADIVVQETRIPETENHRLMIESTRYLNNQLLKEQLAGDDDRLDSLASDQRDVHDWLLQRLQSILLTDFTEYNARPYQRESVGAIMNLYDFAPDPEVAAAAHLVLEYSTAKFAVGSNQGRRLVPFRRHMDDIESHLEKGDSILMNNMEADHQDALGLLYSGQTQQMGPATPLWALPAEAAFGAFSWYQPNKLVLDLAIDKSTPYLQRFRHGGFEEYASGKGYLITAGGVVTDYASSVLGLGQAADKGAGVPTTIMFPSGNNKVTMWDLLSFRGIRYRIKGSFPGGDPANSYDHNVCVERGFACGLNSFVPDDIKACLQKGPPSREPFWSFFDSTTCANYSSGPPVYMVFYSRPCLAAAVGCSDFGFLEAADIPAASPAAFAAFQANVLSRNPSGLIASPPALVAGGGDLPDAVPLPSTYFTSDGRKIEFNPTAHILDSNKNAITAVNGQPSKKLSDWGTAEGDLINKNDWPLVTITNARYPGQSVTLDFRGWGVATYDGPK